MDGQHYNEPASMATTIKVVKLLLRAGANLDLQDKVRSLSCETRSYTKNIWYLLISFVAVQIDTFQDPTG